MGKIDKIIFDKIIRNALRECKYFVTLVDLEVDITIQATFRTGTNYFVPNHFVLRGVK